MYVVCCNYIVWPIFRSDIKCEVKRNALEDDKIERSEKGYKIKKIHAYDDGHVNKIQIIMINLKITRL